MVVTAGDSPHDYFSTELQTPPCAHFGECGGCTLQHLAPDAYVAFKRHYIARMLEFLKVAPQVIKPLLESGAGSRRRAEFTVKVHKGEVSLGFLKNKSHELVDVRQCPVLEPALERFLPTLKGQIVAMRKPSMIARVHLTLLDAGIDMLLSLHAPLKPGDRQGWVEFSQASPIVRLAVRHGEDYPLILHDTEQAVIHHGGVAVTLPAGAFCQASAAAEGMMKTLVSEALRNCSSVIDLYAGCGTFSFPLAAGGRRVTAVEGSQEMISAMYNAMCAAGLERYMTAETRDLFFSPVPAAQLAAYEGIVINPPRNGALPQVKQIAASGVERVVMVSCNPATFQRDADCLLQAGYRLAELTPVDQFTWSRHLELVAVFRKER